MDCFPELQILICEFSQISLNQKGNLRNGISFLIACSAPSALCYAILAVSPQSVIPSGAKFESGTSYLRSMRFLKRFKGFAGVLSLVNTAFQKLRGASKETLIKSDSAIESVFP